MAGKGILHLSAASLDAVDAGIADACLATVKMIGRDKVGFINMAIDVSPRCDCANHADMPIVPHLGVFASTDPVAIDMACVDIARNAPGIPGSAAQLMEVDKVGDNKFEGAAALMHGQSEVATINTGHIIGLGSRDYQLIDVEPADAAKYRFPYDRRPSRQRFMDRFAKFEVFPYDRHDGNGFFREVEVDLENVKRHYGSATNGHQEIEELEDIGVPGDDD